MEKEDFYSIEYWMSGEIDIKHAFMTPGKARELSELLSSKGVRYEIHLLSRPYPSVDSLDDINVLGAFNHYGDRRLESAK
jgi:hypothetical protein